MTPESRPAMDKNVTSEMADMYIKRPIPIRISEPFNGSDEHARQLGLIVSAAPAPGWRYAIQTLEGPLRVPTGHRVVTGVKGERYAIDPDIFRETYIPAKDYQDAAGLAQGVIEAQARQLSATAARCETLERDFREQVACRKGDLALHQQDVADRKKLEVERDALREQVAQAKAWGKHLRQSHSKVDQHYGNALLLMLPELPPT